MSASKFIHTLYGVMGHDSVCILGHRTWFIMALESTYMYEQAPGSRGCWGCCSTPEKNSGPPGIFDEPQNDCKVCWKESNFDMRIFFFFLSAIDQHPNSTPAWKWIPFFFFFFFCQYPQSRNHSHGPAY